MTPTGKRILFWCSLVATGGGAIGSYFFPPCFLIPVLSVFVVGGSFYSLDAEQSDKIKRYETPIDLQELVSGAFPKENNENRQLIRKNNVSNKNRTQHRQEIADETWAKHVFFTEEERRKKNAKMKEGSHKREEENMNNMEISPTAIITSSVTTGDMKDAYTITRPPAF